MSVETIRIEGDAVAAEICPGRGGMVTRLTIGGDEVLYLEPNTLEDPNLKVRGGIPLLFPVAGKLPDDTYRIDGRAYQLRQHGFARDSFWQVVAADKRSVELRLASDHSTTDSFPFRFDVRLKYRASGNTLTIEQTYANMEQRPMPLHVGFHPYFFVPDADKSHVTLSTDATRAWDNLKKEEVAFSGFDLTQSEVDIALLDHEAKEIRIERPGRRTLRLSWDLPFNHVVVWTVKGKDYVCVEPWTGAPGALATGEGLAHIGPRETRKTFFAITAME